MGRKIIMQKQLSLVGLGLGTLAALVGINTTIAVAGSANSTPTETQTDTTSTVGGSLAQQLQGKPTVVEIYASWCPNCKNISKTVSALKQQYQNKINFVVLDVTDKSTTQASEAKAKQLGLSDFFTANKSKTSTVAIIDPSTGQIWKEFQNNPNKQDYVAVLDPAIAQTQKK